MCLFALKCMAHLMLLYLLIVFVLLLDGGIKRKKRKPGPYAGVSVSQLLAQREKLAMTQVYSKDQPTGSPQFIQQQQQVSIIIFHYKLYYNM